jgi:hypothetical protein
LGGKDGDQGGEEGEEGAHDELGNIPHLKRVESLAAGEKMPVP